ncbi:putative F-box protein At1g67623 [Rhodamnia argentea]|uniref:F-box protein At1g67623 n=1 Tax=Rhodamnia argentea TaxID=178133 RepID=A0A8B8P4F9_9MYRT|nr:putative F-box protein At1g67623 [Rhodamnia argentea]
MEIDAFDVLPRDMVVEILASVAANSMDDFFNAKISCKIFNKLGEEDYVYQQISFDKISKILWWHPEEGKAFIQRCIKCNNPEALYTQGLYECVSLVKVELGMELLKRAAQIGPVGASYVVGLLLVCEGGELKKEGVRLLRQVYASGRVVECRKKYIDVVRDMWWNNVAIFGGEPPRYDRRVQNEHCKRRGWVRDIDHYDNTECEQCICRSEIEILYKYGGRP